MRLIPGTATVFQENRKKPPQSVRLAAVPQIGVQPPAARPRETIWEHLFEFFLPRALHHHRAGVWLGQAATDFALIALNWLFVGALIVQMHGTFPQISALQRPAIAPGSLLGIALLHAAMISLIGNSEKLYTGNRDLLAQARVLGKAVVWATALLCVVCRLQGYSKTASLAICGAGILHFSALFVWRGLDLKRGHAATPNGPNVRNVLIVGASTTGRRIASYLEQHPEQSRAVCGFLDDEESSGDGVLGPVRNLAHLARSGFVDEVILAAPHHREQTRWVVREARKLRLDIEVVPDLYGYEVAGHGVEQLGDLPLFCLHKESLPWARLLVKRAMDIAGASVGLVVGALAFVVIAPFIKLDSHGPVFYAALRGGRKGRPFRCYKLRTMVRDADDLKVTLRRRNERSGAIFKIAKDPRVTRVGRFLRRYSIDEMPQFWNVLVGDMSLVGPRPHPLDDCAVYGVEHLSRLDMKPGMTGLWQVTARSDPSFQKGVELDREYIRNWSIGMDVKILCRTFAAVVRGSGQ